VKESEELIEIGLREAVSVTRVVIVASSTVVRAGLESLLATAPMIQVVGSLSIDVAVARLADLEPDVLLLDLESISDESMSLVIESGAVPVGSARVILTDVENFAVIAHSGVKAILPRDAGSEEIMAAVQAAATGLIALHPDAYDHLLSQIRSGVRPELAFPDPILSPREIEILRMIAEGLGNKEIASKLCISDHTVKFHISSIFSKLGAANRAEAVTLGIRQGLLMV
jgi:two-component system, NarL family, response regulator YdfI